MKHIVIPKYGPPDVLEVRRSPTPPLKAHEVRIRVAFTGLGFAEVMARQGLYPDAPPTPCTVGYEISGEIDEVGSEVQDFQPGQRVLALTRFGGHADTVCVDAGFAFEIPDEMSFEEAAALPVNYLTAHHMLFRTRRVQPGETMLLHMAAGGVGTAVLQLAKTVADLQVIGTASAKKHDYVLSQGCHHVIDYHQHDYAEEVERITQGRGVDLVIDALGGHDWRKGYELLRPGGMLIAFGFANMNRGGRRKLLHVARQFLGLPLFNPMTLMDENRALAGVNLGHLWEEREMLRPQARSLISYYERGEIRPHVDRVFPFAKAAEAHRYLEGGHNRGKVLLQPS